MVTEKVKRVGESVRLHVAHGWGGGIDRWIADFVGADDQPSFILRSHGTREAFGEEVWLYWSRTPGEPIMTWQLAQPIGVLVDAHPEYRAIIKGLIEGLGVDSLIVSSLIGHSLDILETDLPTTVVCHDFFPYCAGIVLRFGDVCTACPTDRLAHCLRANSEAHPFGGMTDEVAWGAIRERYLRLLTRPSLALVAPDASVFAHLESLDSRFVPLRKTVIAHGFDDFERYPKPLASTAVAESLEGRPLKVVVLGRLNPHKGLVLLERLFERTNPDHFQFYLCGPGAFGLALQRFPCVAEVVADYEHAQLADLLLRLAPDCGLLASVWPETFSYTLSELSTLGIPPVVTELGALGNRVVDGVSGFVCQADPNSVLQTLEQLRLRPARLQSVRGELARLSHRKVREMKDEHLFLLDELRCVPDTSSRAATSDSKAWLYVGLCQTARVIEGIKQQHEESLERLVGAQSEREYLAERETTLEQWAGELQDRLNLRSAEINALTMREKQLCDELERIKGSRSWRLTIGLRAGAQLARSSLRFCDRALRFLRRQIHDPKNMARLVVQRVRRRQQGATQDVGFSRSLSLSSAAAADVRSPAFVELREGLSVDSRLRAIAFYLPQFHPIPENDAWWGKGFTEWRNVSRAVPQFVGHYQPRLPGELGYYDLRLPQVQKRQMALARNYGIHGFCYYYYWFSGQTLLERPLQQHLADPEMDLPFCVCWANENWTRRWDGNEQDVLMAQRYLPDDPERFIAGLIPFFRDPRYIRDEGRPVLLVYRVDQIPGVLNAVKLWRSHCIEAGVGDPLLLAVQSFEIDDPRQYGFDGAVEFPPHRTKPRWINDQVSMLNPDYVGHVYDYASVIPERASWPGFRLHRGVMPSWDNEARRPGRGNAFVGSEPEAYARWLYAACEATDAHFSKPSEKMVFINAWNEWAEGAYLEPDQRFGYAYLQATADVLTKFPLGQMERIRQTRRPIKNPAQMAVILNLYYEDLWEEIAVCLSNLEDFDLFVSVRADLSPRMLERILSDYPNAQLYAFANRGRDIGPFFEIMREVGTHHYPLICKIHSKKSLHRQDGEAWRRDLLDKLLGQKAVAGILAQFDRDPQLGLVGPRGHLLPGSTFWGSNEVLVRELLKRIGADALDIEGFSFFAGSMFWFRPRALRPLFELGLCLDDFEPEKGQLDGTLAHAIERLFPFVLSVTGFKQAESGDPTAPSAAEEAPNRGSYAYADEG